MYFLSNSAGLERGPWPVLQVVVVVWFGLGWSGGRAVERSGVGGVCAEGMGLRSGEGVCLCVCGWTAEDSNSMSG